MWSVLEIRKLHRGRVREEVRELVRGRVGEEVREVVRKEVKAVIGGGQGGGDISSDLYRLSWADI